MNIRGRFVLFILPTFGRAGISFLMLPITTFYLDPADFGFYALVTSITGISAAIACSGSGYALASSFPTAGVDEQKSLVSTVLAASLGVGLALSILMFTIWRLSGWEVIGGIVLSPALIFLSVALMILPIPWTYGVQVATLDGQTRSYAIIQFFEAVIAGAATILVLYFSSEKQLALFIGGAAGALFTVFGALWILRPYLGGRINSHWLREIAGVGFASLISIFAEKTQTIVERAYISAYVGIEQLGIYAHSQQYRSLVAAGAKSVSYSVWPVSLEEAREEDSEFARTALAWHLTGAFLTFAGVTFATLGEYVLSLLTHGKFASAYVFAALWMAYLLIQSTGRVQTARLYVNRAGVGNQNAVTFSVVLSIILLVLLVPAFGIYGVVIGVFSQVICYRGLLNLLGRRGNALPFIDGPLIAGVAIVIASTAVAVVETKFSGRIINFLVSGAVIAVVFRSSFGYSWNTIISPRLQFWCSGLNKKLK